MKPAQWNRADIITAWAQLEADYNVGGWLPERPSNQRRLESCGVQIARMGVDPYGVDAPRMTRNASRIYRNAEQRLKLKEPNA